MSTLAAIAITKNEEQRIASCLESVRGLADEIVVLDSGSTDATVDIAERYTDRVFYNRFENFARQRNAALRLPASDWVLFIDADEQCTPELAAEIRKAINREPDADEPVAYGIPRRNYMFGRWFRHAGWYPDYQYRLFRRDKGRYDEKRGVHELAIFDGPVGRLNSEFLHFNYDTLGEFYSKQNAYALLEARSRYDAGARARARNFVLQPMREFRRRFIGLGGRKEGALGFIISALMALFEFRVYLELWRLRHGGSASHGDAC